jgi:hypothetical protein
MEPREPREPREPQEPANAAERSARDAVRALARPRPDAAFRTRLRHEFTTGRFGRRVPADMPRPWWALKRIMVPVAAAVLAVSGAALNRGPDWRIVAATGDGRVTFAGAPGGASLSPSDPAVAAFLKRGGHVLVDSTLTLDLVAPGVAAVMLAPGAEVMLSSTPGRWWGRGMRAELMSGNAYFTTGRAFHGAHLDVRTAEVSVRAVGTAFAVLREPHGTCVCVMHGRVRVSGAGGSLASAVEVPAGMRRVVHPDGSGVTGPILDDSVARLRRQQDVAGEMLGR